MISTDEPREHIVSNAVKFIRYVVGDMRRRNSCRIDSDRLKFPPNCISFLLRFTQVRLSDTSLKVTILFQF